MSVGTADPNTIAPSPAAISSICAYPLAKLRKDMSIQEYTTYKMDWEIFNKVWAYNYTVSTLNGRTGKSTYSYYQFLTIEDQVSYIRGQGAHAAFYSNAPVGQFATIR
jgi:hypothetical protein